MDYYKNLDLAPINYFCEFDLIWKTEEWRDIPDYECLYQVSDLGRVKSLKFGKEKILKNSGSGNNYLIVSLQKNKTQKIYKIHQIVAITFLNHNPCGYDLVVNHKNFIKTDNRKLNLEIITQRQNGNKKHLKSSSKFTGVSWDKQMKKWRSTIQISGKQKCLGLFIIEEDASKAYNDKLKEITSNKVF